MWVITAWQCMSPGVTVKGFKKCCISNTIDEIDDMFSHTSEEDGNVRTKCEEDEGTDCADEDSDTDW